MDPIREVIGTNSGGTPDLHSQATGDGGIAGIGRPSTDRDQLHDERVGANIY